MNMLEQRSPKDSIQGKRKTNQTNNIKQQQTKQQLALSPRERRFTEPSLLTQLVVGLCISIMQRSYLPGCRVYPSQAGAGDLSFALGAEL